MQEECGIELDVGNGLLTRYLYSRGWTLGPGEVRRHNCAREGVALSHVLRLATQVCMLYHLCVTACYPPNVYEVGDSVDLAIRYSVVLARQCPDSAEAAPTVISSIQPNKRLCMVLVTVHRMSVAHNVFLALPPWILEHTSSAGLFSASSTSREPHSDAQWVCAPLLYIAWPDQWSSDERSQCTVHMP